MGRDADHAIEGEAAGRDRRAADVAALAVILLAGLLSATWAFLVPIFQATDEAGHFDYAASIFSAGHLVRTSGRPVAWVVSPYTRYLLGATDYFRVAFHSSMRAPRGYGSFAFYQRLDRAAPGLKTPADPRAPISYIAPAYPFGFYALEAGVMKIAALSTGSLVAVFFAGRLLCVFLTMLGLYFCYRTALNLGVPPWLGVALIIATGFFPLTSLVSSYIQPDNLAFTLVWATLFFATRLRVARSPLASTAALGVCLGCLVVTKYHFFLAAALPSALLVLTLLWSQRPRPLLAGARVLALFLPTVLLLSIQLAFAAPNYAQGPKSAPASPLLDAFYGSLQQGISPTLVYLFRNLAKALLDCFVTGPNAATYWGALGLWDTPLIIGNERVEWMLRAVIAVASIVVGAIIVYLLASNGLRLLRVARRGRPKRAALIGTRDPALGSYILFASLMIAFYAVTDNVFGMEGRHWYPFIFAAFLCTAWYAPRTFRRLRRHGPPVVATALALYALLASGFATAAVIHRYYATPSPRYTAVVPSAQDIAAGYAVGALWPIQGLDFHALAVRRFRDTFTPGSRLWAGGAAIFPRWHVSAGEVAIVVDDRIAVRTLAGQYNFQLAEATRDFTYGYSGFFGAFSTQGLSEGAHTVTALAKMPDGSSYQRVQPRRLFFLMRGDHFSAAFLEGLARAPIVRGWMAGLESCSDASMSERVVRVPADDVLVVRGKLAERFTEGLGSVVWLLVDDRPYPARYGDDGRSFFGTIPAFELGPGAHAVSAYVAVPGVAHYRRVPGRERFQVERHRSRLRPTWIARPEPPECND